VVVKMAGSDATVFSPPPRERAEPRTSRLLVAVLAALILLGALCGLEVGGAKLLLVLGGVGALLAIFHGLPYVSHHHEWLICALVLIFLINAFFFLNPTARAAFHYGTLALFCLPVVATALRSDVFRNGGFRLYTIYFLWAAVTITYSLAPEYSLARLSEAFMILVALAAIVLDVRDTDGATRLLAHFLVGAGAILALIAASAMFLPHSLTWISPLESFTPDELRGMQKLGITVDGVDRFRGLLSGPNDIGGLMLILVGPAIVCWRTAARRRRILLAAVIVVSVSLAALADSRSPFVALAAGGTLYAIWRWRARGILLLAAAAAAAAGVLMMVTHGNLIAYIGRGNVSTLTGRTDIWAFVVDKIKARPILGYGYDVSGAIFQSRYFPIWWGPWDLGPHSSLHDGYLDHAVGVGIPATLLWLFIILRPWVFVFRQPGDPWNLKSIFLLIVIPILINNLTEELLGDFMGSVGVLFGLTWALGERYRLFALEHAEAERAAAFAKLPRAAMALAGTGESRAAAGVAGGSRI
jgi:hypothetical protein